MVATVGKQRKVRTACSGRLLLCWRVLLRETWAFPLFTDLSVKSQADKG